MSKGKFKTYLWQFFIALAPVPLTIILTVLYIQEKPSLNYLEYLENVNNGIIDLPPDLSKDIDIFYTKKRINNLSSSCYRIFNWSNKDFSDVRIYINLDPKGTKSVNFTLLKKMIKGPDGYPQYGFKELKTNDKYGIGWEIKAVNRSLKISDYFQIDLLFLNEKVPIAKLCVEKKGLNIRPWNPVKREIKKELIIIISLVVILFLYAFFLFIIILHAKKSKNIFMRNFPINLKKLFVNNDLMLGDQEDPDKISKQIISVYHGTKLQSSTRFYLFIKKLFKLE